MELQGQTALITGGGTGLGRAIALLLAQAGCAVAVNYSRSRDAAIRTRDELTDLGVKALAVQADVTDPAQVAGMVQHVTDELGPIGVLICSAGTTVHVPFSDLDGVSADDWDRIMAVNVKGAFLAAQAVASGMRARGRGHIVNIASSAGLLPTGSSIPYSVSKAAMIHLTRCLATGLAPEIRVNAVAPGFMRTGWWEGFPEERLQAIEQGIPLQTAASIDDVAAGVLYILTSDSLTGTTLAVDGGISMH